MAAALEGVGGVAVGEQYEFAPTVFCFERPKEVRKLVCKKVLTNLDIEMASLLLLWLVIENVVPGWIQIFWLEL